MSFTYLPLEQVALINEVKASSLRTLFYKKNFANDYRFKVIDGKYYSIKDYKHPFSQKLEELRLKALIVAKNEHNLCKELSHLGGIKKTTLLKYFYRFTFRNSQQALKIIYLLELYIKQNCLLLGEDLVYE